MMERYGDYFSGTDYELDETLLEYSSAQQEPGVAGGPRSRSRKSAGPAMLAAAAAGPEFPSATGPAAGPRPPLSRQRRRTLGPGQAKVRPAHGDASRWQTSARRGITSAPNCRHC